MQINGIPAEPPTLVSNNWSLTPSELGARDQFRLLFLSSTTRNATSSDIEDYNTFIQNRAAAGHTDIQAYSNGFKVVGCTEDDDARDNTRTTFTSSDKGVPIYWLGGRTRSPTNTRISTTAPGTTRPIPTTETSWASTAPIPASRRIALGPAA